MNTSKISIVTAFTIAALSSGCGLNSNPPAPAVSTVVPTTAPGITQGVTPAQGAGISNPTLQAPQSGGIATTDLRSMTGRFAGQLALYVQDPYGQPMWAVENYVLQLTPAANGVFIQLQSQGQAAWNFTGTLVQVQSSNGNLNSGNTRWVLTATLPQASPQFGISSVSLLIAVPATTEPSGVARLDWAQAAIELRDCASSQNCARSVPAVQFAQGLQVQ